MSDKTNQESSDKSDPDRDRLGKRLGRYAKVGGGVSNLALKLAGEKFLGIDIKRDDHAAQIKQALGNVRGPIMKVAQLLATIPGAVPDEYACEFQELQAKAPPMGWPFVRRRMRGELGAEWQSLFQEFPHEAENAASLGQVHKAITNNGQTVACKIQYPDMISAVRADSQQMRILLNLFERYDKSISTKFIMEELEERLWEELDYELEAKHMALYHDMLSPQGDVHVPEPIAELSTKRLLTATWLDGAPITDFETAPVEQKNRIAISLFHAWYRPLYNYGAIHGDPHLGNYSVRPDDSINLLDFGCVRIFPPRFIHGVIKLYRALQSDDRDMAVHAFEQWGFDNLDSEVIDILIRWAKFLYDPILDDSVRVIGQSDHGVYGRETAMEVHKALREARGGVAIPREFVFMDRAALGLGSVFIRLQAKVNWHDLFQGLIDGFDPEILKKQQSMILEKHGLSDKISE